MTDLGRTSRSRRLPVPHVGGRAYGSVERRGSPLNEIDFEQANVAMVSRTVVQPPPWIEGIPTDHRGFPVPAEAGWGEENRPLIALVDSMRKVGLLTVRACAVCGFRMAEGRPVYRAFSQADAAQIRGYEREFSHDLAGPLHKSCTLYSVLVCPYLRQRNARLGKASTIQPGARRGTLAAVMGFQDMCLMVYARSHQFMAPNEPPPYAGYLGLVEDIKYHDGIELKDAYVSAVAEDAEHIDMTDERHYWMHDDLDGLERLLWAQTKAITDGQPINRIEIQGIGEYVGFRLP